MTQPYASSLQMSGAITGIDTHAHIFSPDQPMAATRRYTPDYTARLEDWLAHQDRNGLSHGVLIQPSFLGTDNSLIAAALARHPGRLRGVAVVDPEISEAELYQMHSRGFVGVRLNLVGRILEDYAQPHWQLFFRRIARLGWQVEIQRRFEDLPQVVPAIAEAGARVMIDHFGLPQGGIDPEKPAHRAVLTMLADTPRAWVKLSAPYRSGLGTAEAAASFLHLRVAMGGIDRMVWGSDWPHTQHEAETGYEMQVARLDALIPDTGDRRRILVDNPASLFRFI